MNISKNIDSIIDILKENKAIDILKIDVKKLTSTVDFMVLLVEHLLDTLEVCLKSLWQWQKRIIYRQLVWKGKMEATGY